MRAYFHRVSDASGAAAIEFALLTPIYLLLLCGTLAYGLYFAAAHSVQQLAADAARIAVAGIDTAERNRLVSAYLARNSADYLLLDAAKLQHAIGDKPDDPDFYRVTLTYDARELPIWNLYLPLPLPRTEISFTSTIRRGGL